jgi:hypothetical protein
MFQPLDVPTLEMVGNLTKIRCDEEEGDFLDGLVVGLDTIHRRTAKKKYTKQIFLVTDAANQVKDMDQASSVLDRIKELEVQLFVM